MPRTTQKVRKSTSVHAPHTELPMLETSTTLTTTVTRSKSKHSTLAAESKADKLEADHDEVNSIYYYFYMKLASIGQ
jgi:hypothetical protein